MSMLWIDLFIVAFGVLLVIIAYHRHRSHSPELTVLLTGWSHSQYWVKRALLRCNAGIFLSVVTVLIFMIFEGGR